MVRGAHALLPLRLARYTARELSKRPTFALTAILSLALGIAAAALACFVPARRASSIDPMEALRYE